MIKFPVKLQFNDDGSKRVVYMPSGWQSLEKTKPIGLSKNWAIQTGARSNITVIDCDIKIDCDHVDGTCMNDEGECMNSKDGKGLLTEKYLIDLDEYDTYVVQTQSGGWHYYFKYDDRLKTAANIIKGVDIRNDSGCVFAGDRYRVINNVEPKIMPEELFDVLCKREAPIKKPTEPTDEISQKYYDLIKLLPRRWFNDFDKWMKPAYALYNCNEIDKDTAFNTWNKLLHDLSDHYNEAEAKRCWGRLTATTQPYTFGSIKQVVSKENKDGYQSWCSSYPSMREVKSTKQKILDEENRIERIKADVLSHLHECIERVDRSVIKEPNNIEFNDLVMNEDKTYSVEDLALLLRQTIIRVENNGEPMLHVKEILESKYKRSYVESIRFIPRTMKQMKIYRFNAMHNDDVAMLKLSEILHAVKKHINHKKVVLEPYGALDVDISMKRNNFNLFAGLLHKYDAKFEVDESIVFIWLNHLKHVISNNDESVYLYLLKYFKHILINPMEKTGTVIIIKGKQGSGKNAAFDIFNRYVLGPNLSSTTPRMDLITGRFNSIRQSMIMCVLDEAVDNSDRSVMNKFKSLITSDEVQIEYKGKEPITLNDFCNYVVISNNDFASFIEESDRRSLCLETNNDMIGNRQYFNKYWKTLDNAEAGKHIFHWLINNVVINDDWHPQDTPSTSYKQTLKQSQAPTPIKFLLHTLEVLKESNDDETREIEMKSELFPQFLAFCETQHYKKVSMRSFSIIVKPYIHNRKTNGKRLKVYSREILEETLQSYLYEEKDEV